MSREHYEALLRDVARSGVYQLPHQDVSELLGAIDALDYGLFRVDLEQVSDKAGFLDAVAAALDFPDWFGHNWDALEDCLTDMSWWPAGGYVVILQACDGFRSAHGEDFQAALQIFGAAAESWRSEGVAFWTLADMHADGIVWLPGLP